MNLNRKKTVLLAVALYTALLRPASFADGVPSNSISDAPFAAIKSEDVRYVVPESEKTPGDFIRISTKYPRYFEHPDGRPFIVNGPNLCFPCFREDDTSFISLGKLAEVYERWFSVLEKNGCNFTRIWVGHPFSTEFETAAGVYDETRIKNLDKIVELAGRHGVRLKLCLEQFREVYSYPVFVSLFTKPIYGKKNGGPLCRIQDMNTEAGKQLFMRRADFLARRYCGNPTVMIIELWNEMNCVDLGGFQQLLDWNRDILVRVKKLFPNQLVCNSIGSFDSPYVENLYRGFMPLVNNDIVQVHRYLDLGAEFDVCHAPMDVLTADATSRMFEFSAGCARPVLAAEIGAVRYSHTGPFPLYAKDRQGLLLHDAVFAPFFSGAAGSGQTWWWELYVDPNNLWWHYGRFAEAVRGVDPASEAFRPVKCEHDYVRFYTLLGRNTALVWCRDSVSDWRSELLSGIPAKPVTADIPIGKLLPNQKRPKSAISVYDPWNDRHSEMKCGTESLRVTFTRSAVLRIGY